MPFWCILRASSRSTSAPPQNTTSSPLPVTMSDAPWTGSPKITTLVS